MLSKACLDVTRTKVVRVNPLTFPLTFDGGCDHVGGGRDEAITGSRFRLSAFEKIS
jgi:hypothetical protein